MKSKILTLYPNDFSPLLEGVLPAVKKLYVLSNNFDDLLARPRVAIVGSRKTSAYGRGVTGQLARDLAQQGIVIVSGLALGTDSIAHKATLDAGGKTIAVLPSGLHNIYPSSHRQLAAQIVAQGGALISEHEHDFRPFPYSFVERNRIVSGLSDALLVTEAAKKSGTLTTANFAREQHKPIFAVPGNITSPSSEGTNHLIAHGATLTTSAHDILKHLAITPNSQQKQKSLPVGATPAEQAIIDLVASGIHETDLLANHSGLSTADLNEAFTMLEIAGAIKRVDANHWQLP